MSMKDMTVDALLAKVKWRAERLLLRSILLDCGLHEEVKWGKLCYMVDGANVVLIHGLKDHCALNFFKGALLSDPDHLLSSPGENSQSARWMKFSSADEISAREPMLRAYIGEAVAIEKAGLKVELKTKDELVLVAELQERLDEDAALKQAFEALTPGRQRGYNLFISAPKQSATRVSRIEKCRPKILEGKGLNDR
jgi:uncharacterized protein YdeI (YjbR/CyaY-like superfamily)